MTVLIIALGLSLGAIIFLWFKWKDEERDKIKCMKTLDIITDQLKKCLDVVPCCKPSVIKAIKYFKMATNHITVTFTPCSPAPSGGYIIKYRPVGDLGPYRTATGSPFTTSPAAWDDTLDAEDTAYEGFIQSDCGDGNLGLEVPFETEVVVPSVACRTYILSKTVGTPSAHYIDCGGVTRDTLINSGTSICTNGHGFTISGGGITVDSFTDGCCGVPATCGQYQATGEAAEGTPFTWIDCDGIENNTTIAFNDNFLFCTCDVNPQYSTADVTVVRMGDCP